MIFESHAHYDDSKFDDDREELLSTMQENGIEKIINIGCSICLLYTSPSPRDRG